MLAAEAQGHRVTPAPTRGPMTAAPIAAECAARQADLILVAGGDGTVNEVVNGVAGMHVPLAAVPAGTANVLAMELGLGRNAVAAIQGLSQWTPRRIALGRLYAAGRDPRFFVCMCGAGLDAIIVYRIDAQLKSRIGKAAYWIAGFSQFGRSFPEFQAEIDSARVRSSFALLSRVRNYGGDLSIARGASLLKDQFEAVLFSGSRSAPYLKYLTGVITGRLAAMKGVTVGATRSAMLECAADPRIYVQVDGEFAGNLPARVELVPDALTLLMPPGFQDSGG